MANTKYDNKKILSACIIITWGLIFCFFVAGVKVFFELWPFVDKKAVGEIEILKEFGPFKVPRHIFMLFACIFSLGILTLISDWLKKFKDRLEKDFPVLATCCFFVSLLLLFLSCMSPSFWLLIVAFLWVTCMTMDASCRYSSTESKEWTKQDKKTFKKSLGFCVAVSIGILFFVFSKNLPRQVYLASFPILLIVVPRWLMHSQSVRQDNRFVPYAWYHTYTILVLIMSLAHVGFKWLLPVISQIRRGEMSRWFIEGENNMVKGLLSKRCDCDLLSFFVIVSLIGLISYFIVFPRKK